MQKYPPKGRATSRVTQIRGFSQSRGLLVANCQLGAEICYNLFFFFAEARIGDDMGTDAGFDDL